jgi:hypothetical protein
MLVGWYFMLVQNWSYADGARTGSLKFYRA